LKRDDACPRPVDFAKRRAGSECEAEENGHKGPSHDL
jgi:hypothetical protein